MGLFIEASRMNGARGLGQRRDCGARPAERKAKARLGEVRASCGCRAQLES